MKYLNALLIFLMALLLAAFIQQNLQPVSIDYFSWHSPQMALSLYMIIAFAAGYLLALLLGFSGSFRYKMRLHGAEREVKRLRREVSESQAASTPHRVPESSGSISPVGSESVPESVPEAVGKAGVTGSESGAEPSAEGAAEAPAKGVTESSEESSEEMPGGAEEEAPRV